MNIGMIMLSAIIGAITGDNIGYFVGYHYGYYLLEKYGSKIGITRDRQLVGQYLFRKFGGFAVFIARFIAIFRLFVAILAGASRMPWMSFLCFNILGGIIWAGGYSFLTYEIGKEITHFSFYIGIIIALILLTCLTVSFFCLRRHERYLIILAKKDHFKKLKYHRKKKSLSSRAYNNHNDNNHH